MPIDAEQWLASRGVPRERLIGDGTTPTTSPPPVADRTPSSPSSPSAPSSEPPTVPPPGVREVLALARQAAAEPDPVGPVRGRTGAAFLEPEGADGETASDQERGGGPGVVAALAFIHRSTANAPQSEGRLRRKLEERDYPGPVIDEALADARAQRLVDDDAMLAALIAERRARGHADRRLRRDLRDRGFTGQQVDDALSLHAPTDPAAAAFDLARDEAARHRSVEAEVAVRRTVGHLLRRGHPEGLARKAARDAVYADREAQDIAGR